MSKPDRKPCIPDYAGPESQRDIQSREKRPLRDVLWMLFGEVMAQIVLPAVLCLIVLFLCIKGCIGQH